MTAGASETATRFVLRDEVGRDEVDDALFERGCTLINVVAPSQSHPGQMIYATRDRRGVVYVIEDAVLGVTYLSGAGEVAVAELAALTERLPSWRGNGDVAALLATARDDGSIGSGPGKILGVLALTAGSEPGDARVAVFADALAHSSAEVRLAALVALLYASTPWSALRDLVAQLASGDADAFVRLHAGRVLETYGP
jgi:hypothetical protein